MLRVWIKFVLWTAMIVNFFVPMLLSKLWSAWSEAGLNDFYVFLASFALLLILGGILGSIALGLYVLIAGKQRVLSQTPSARYCWTLLVFVAITAHIGWLATLVIFGVYRLITKSLFEKKQSPHENEPRVDKSLSTESVDNYFYSRQCSSDETVIIYKKYALYIWGLWALLALSALLFSFNKTYFYWASSFLGFFIAFFTIKYWPITREVRNALKSGGVKVIGSKFSLSRPLTITIPRPSNLPSQ